MKYRIVEEYDLRWDKTYWDVDYRSAWWDHWRLHHRYDSLEEAEAELERIRRRGNIPITRVIKEIKI